MALYVASERPPSSSLPPCDKLEQHYDTGRGDDVWPGQSYQHGQGERAILVTILGVLPKRKAEAPESELGTLTLRRPGGPYARPFDYSIGPSKLSD